MVSELRQLRDRSGGSGQTFGNVKEKPELFYKLKDIQTLYKGFFDYLEGKFITQEEVLDVLAQRAEQSEKLRDSTVVLDGYTGFTPIQIQVLEKLLKLCRQVYIPLTVGRGEDPYRLEAPMDFFILPGRLCINYVNLQRRRKSPGTRPGSREKENNTGADFRRTGRWIIWREIFSGRRADLTEAGKKRFLSGRL